MAVNYTDVQKTEKYISRTNFDALEMAAVPEGTEFNIVDQIHESDLDSDVLQKLNNNAKINTANTFTAAQTFKKDITIEGNIIQNGSAYETHAEKLYTKNDMIYTRDGATAALADNTYTGIQAVKYDGTNDGQLVFGKDGVARVGDIGNTQPLATRAEAGALVDEHLLQWDAAGQTLVDSGKTVKDLEGGGGDVTAAGNNTFTGANTFTSGITVAADSTATSAHIVYGSDGIKVKVEGNVGISPDLAIKIPYTVGTFAIIRPDTGLETPKLRVSGSAEVDNMLLSGLTFQSNVKSFTALGVGEITFPSKPGILVTTNDISSFVKNNASTNFSVYDEVSGNKSTLGYSGLTLEDPVAHNTCTLSAAGLVHKQMNDDEQITLHNTTLAFENNGLTTTLTVPNKTGTLALSEDVFKLNGENTSSAINTYSGAAYFNASTHFTKTPDFQSGKISKGAVTLTFPTKTGTLAITDDLPVANPTAEGTTALTKLKIGDVVYTIPSGGGGSGDVTAAGNNTFTGTNKFNQKLQVSNLTGNIGSKDYGIFISAMDGIKCVAPARDSDTAYKQFTLNSEYIEFHAGDVGYT